jgi:hypothetical protein
MAEEGKPLRKNLEETLDEADWSWFAPHLKRDALILISIELDIVTVGEKIAQDDKAQVTEWIRNGKISKPTPQQIEDWNKSPEKKFLSLIVQPYVLAQEYVVH